MVVKSRTTCILNYCRFRKCIEQEKCSSSTLLWLRYQPYRHNFTPEETNMLLLCNDLLGSIKRGRREPFKMKRFITKSSGGQFERRGNHLYQACHCNPWLFFGWHSEAGREQNCWVLKMRFNCWKRNIFFQMQLSTEELLIPDALVVFGRFIFMLALLHIENVVLYQQPTAD